MEGDDSLDLSSTMPLNSRSTMEQYPFDEFEENEEIYTDKLRNISVNFSSSLPIKLRLLLGPVMIFCLIVLMVFQNSETNKLVFL